MLPLEEREEDLNSIVSDGYITKTAKIVNESFNYKDAIETEDLTIDGTIREIKDSKELSPCLVN